MNVIFGRFIGSGPLLISMLLSGGFWEQKTQQKSYEQNAKVTYDEASG